MSQSTIAIVILIAVIILFATEKLPLAVTSVLAMGQSGLLKNIRHGEFEDINLLSDDLGKRFLWSL